MALIFITIDPETDSDHCPAVFVEEETGDLLFQGWTVTDPATLAWLAGKPLPCPANTAWSQLVRTHTARGVRFRRARVVSEPLADYIRFENAITDEVNVSAGEEVHWLPRRRASDLFLPGNDFWLFDDRLIRFSYFSGDGHILEDELVSDMAMARMCSAAFEAVWERSIPHAEYRPT